MPSTLRELGVEKKDLKQLSIDVTFQHTRVIQDVISIDEQMAFQIFTEAYE